MAAPMLRGDRTPPSSLNTKWHPRSTSFFLERRPNWKEGASSQLEHQRTKKKTKDGQQQSSLASQGGEKVADRAETVRWDEGELQLRAGVFFPARTNMLFGNVVILQQKLNPSHYAQPTRSSPLAAAETSARSCAPSSLFILRPHSADAWSSPTLNRHRSPITQQKFPSPLFFQRETKPEAKTQVELVMNWLRLSASDSSVSGI